jgi:hypothetical protein
LRFFDVAGLLDAEDGGRGLAERGGVGVESGTTVKSVAQTDHAEDLEAASIVPPRSGTMLARGTPLWREEPRFADS